MRMTVLAVLVALFVLPTSAGATTRWFLEERPIAEGKIVQVATTSPDLTVNLKLPKRTTIKIPCSAVGTAAFWNSPTEGLDETQALNFSCPERTTVTPALPWASTLLESALPLHDQWESVRLQLTYNGVDYGTFSGSLTTTVGDVDPQKDRETLPKDEVDNFLTFREHALVGPNEAKLWFSGIYHLGSKGSRVTDSSGAWSES